MVRALRAEDAAALAALTLAAIQQLGPRGYTTEQVAAWAARHPDAESMAQRWDSGHLIRVACGADDAPLAYALMEPDGHLDMLYCHPAHAGKGLACGLLEAVELAARALALPRLFTEASELARPVFARAGYSVIRRRNLCLGGVAIHNYAMEKCL